MFPEVDTDGGILLYERKMKKAPDADLFKVATLAALSPPRTWLPGTDPSVLLGLCQRLGSSRSELDCICRPGRPTPPTGCVARCAPSLNGASASLCQESSFRIGRHTG